MKTTKLASSPISYGANHLATTIAGPFFVMLDQAIINMAMQ